MNTDTLQTLDGVRLEFSPTAALVLQGIVAIVVFGVALELRISDFARLLREPRLVATGLAAQLVALPLLTFALVGVLDPAPSIALGMMMIAACPGGNMSNVLTHWAHGRTSLSVAMTTISSLAAPATTPLVFGMLGGLHPTTRGAMRDIALPYGDIVAAILLALALPLVLGMAVAERRPVVAARLRGPLKRFGVLVLFAFVGMALFANKGLFAQPSVAGVLIGLVVVHNALALATGYWISRLLGAGEAERRAITLETGIHNSALGLMLIFSYFQHLGGMALIVATWGIWHLVTGGVLARHWARRKPAIVVAAD